MYIRIRSNVFIMIDINEIGKKYDKISDENIIYVKEVEGNGLVIKNIIFDIDNRFTYKMRQQKYEKLRESKKYKLRLLIYESKVNGSYIYNDYKNMTIMLSDMQSKIRVSSILLNNETLTKYIGHELGMVNNKNTITYERLLEKMREETIKKWIYNNYSADNIERILVEKKNKQIIVSECFKSNNMNESDKIEIIEIKRNNKKAKINDGEYYEKDGIKYSITKN